MAGVCLEIKTVGGCMGKECKIRQAEIQDGPSRLFLFFFFFFCSGFNLTNDS